MKKYIFSFLFIFLGTRICFGESVRVENNIEGGLKKQIEIPYEIIDHLYVSGQINGNDISFIHKELLHLKSLDLSNAKLVKGGYIYYYEEQKEDTIGTRSFSEMKELQTVVFPKNLKAIEGEAFYNCESLEKVIIPDSVYEIGESAFEGCFSIRKIHIGNNVRKLYSKTFTCCKLDSLVVPSTLEYLDCSFFGSSIKNLIFEKSETKLSVGSRWLSYSTGGYVDNKKPLPLFDCIIDTIELNRDLDVNIITPFYGGNYKTVKIKSNCDTLPSSAFQLAYIDSLYIENSPKLLSTDRSAFSADRITSLYIDRNIDEKYFTYSSYPGVRFLQIGDNTTEIADEEYCNNINLNNIILGKNIVYIGEKAFGECRNLKCIYSLNSIPPNVYSDATFSYRTYSMCHLIVPEGSIDLYKVAPVWKNFLNIEESDEHSGTVVVECINDSKSNANSIYTIQGLKINNTIDFLPNGLYIINGKKVLIQH